MLFLIICHASFIDKFISSSSTAEIAVTTSPIELVTRNTLLLSTKVVPSARALTRRRERLPRRLRSTLRIGCGANLRTSETLRSSAKTEEYLTRIDKVHVNSSYTMSILSLVINSAKRLSIKSALGLTKFITLPTSNTFRGAPFLGG